MFVNTTDDTNFIIIRYDNTSNSYNKFNIYNGFDFSDFDFNENSLIAVNLNNYYIFKLSFQNFTFLYSAPNCNHEIEFNFSEKHPITMTSHSILLQDRKSKLFPISSYLKYKIVNFYYYSFM